METTDTSGRNMLTKKTPIMNTHLHEYYGSLANVYIYN